VQQIRTEAGDGPAAAAATGERLRRYKAPFGSGFSIFLCREIAQAANHVGWKRGVNFIPDFASFLISSSIACTRLLCHCRALLSSPALTLELILIITVL
jgi:hypothetical protein